MATKKKTAPWDRPPPARVRKKKHVTLSDAQKTALTQGTFAATANDAAAPGSTPRLQGGGDVREHDTAVANL